ncbi:hypothetical protein ADK60_08650 [Streptomyces sp. XY431]|uniref:hypothetical protein n=1 Tax=Streptomyces sp. XY431 TaxID=1415562 RepID=UPI0006B0651E|nr:hypothetical protein [Streptomyces sp. XY431]KOV35761.1 hypothetical protein ADK60_08650 [Streptomyces sp. XY431]
MALAVSRDTQIAALYERLHHRSVILSGLTPGSDSHAGIQAECDAIHAEIRRLQAATSISPKAVLIGIAVLLLIAWSALH